MVMIFNKFREELRAMPYADYIKLVELAELEEEERLLIKYAVREKCLVDNICLKLFMDRATYFRKLPIALVKLYYTKSLIKSCNFFFRVILYTKSMEDIFMLDKIKNRLEKEVDKIISKEDLSIAEYIFLQKVLEDIKTDALQEYILGGNKCKCQCSKEMSQA